jgi:hypothetical protein
MSVNAALVCPDGNIVRGAERGCSSPSPYVFDDTECLRPNLNSAGRAGITNRLSFIALGR